jgi:alkanesulfonate monooxygenase SsuD/methylene tetrahydromethanopterin reductase-like flavin-dependent oxidoreductase (luciferase family)
MHFVVSLAEHGWHPAAWRLSDAPAFAAARPFIETARLAERGGFDAIILGPAAASAAGCRNGRAGSLALDPLPLAASLIGVTQRIGIGVDWPMDASEPYHVARVGATLDHLSLGRFGWRASLLGADRLRANFPTAALLENPVDAAERAGEFIDVVRQLWDSWEDEGFAVDQATGTFADSSHVHPIAHQGRFFAVRGPLNVPRPPQGCPVIFANATADDAFRRTAIARADVLLAECARIEDAAALRAVSDKKLLVTIMPILAGSDEAARRHAAMLDGLSAYGSADLPRRFVGTPEGFAAHMATWHAAGVCDGFHVLPAQCPRDLTMVTDGVIPLLRKQGLARSGYQGSTLRAHLGLPRPRSQFAA